jgi:SOS-response transcriptional repressor LexA
MTNEVLPYLETFIAENGYAPSVREIQEQFKWASPDTAQRRLRALVDAGLIERVGPRAIRIVQDA